MSVANFDSRFESEFSMETKAVLSEKEMPFRILMLGDWAGKSQFFDENYGSNKPLEIDRDNFDDLIAKIRPRLELSFANTDNKAVNISFESLDDFHPDQIFQNVSIFSELRIIRQKLKNPNTFDVAASEVRSWYQPETGENSGSDSENTIQPTDKNLLDSILSGQSAPEISATPHKSELSVFISEIVSPYKVKTDLDEQSKLIGIVDEVISDLMRKIIHHKEFQQLESAWRGLYFLVKNTETTADLKIYLAHLQKRDLLDNLSVVNNLDESKYFKMVSDEFAVLPENEVWAFAGADYGFQINIEDIASLIRISKVSADTGVPFISNINPSSFGFGNGNSEKSDSVADEDSNEQKLWLALRSLPTSKYIGMTMPRFIGRLPYGAATEPTEVFDFEEFNGDFRAENYLWVSSVFAYSLVLAQEFRQHSWNIDVNRSFEITNLPLHIYSSPGSTVTSSCIEVPLGESDFIEALEQGVMPVISFRSSDSIRLSALRSVSLESSVLEGLWTRK